MALNAAVRTEASHSDCQLARIGLPLTLHPAVTHCLQSSGVPYVCKLTQRVAGCLSYVTYSSTSLYNYHSINMFLQPLARSLYRRINLFNCVLYDTIIYLSDCQRNWQSLHMQFLYICSCEQQILNLKQIVKSFKH